MSIDLRTTVLVKSFAHFMLCPSCEPPAGGGLTLNKVEYEYINKGCSKPIADNHSEKIGQLQNSTTVLVKSFAHFVL